MLVEIESFFAATAETALGRHHADLREALGKHVRRHGRAAEWDAVLNAVPCLSEPGDFDTDTIRLGPDSVDIEQALEALKPWRKGPIQIGRTVVDTEWRSDWKWQRITPHVSDLSGRQVLDIGCGNGYHLYRMLGAGASLALGIDPTVLFNYQFALMQKLCTDNHAYLLPLRGEHLPAFGCFDTVFSMGVLYHRRSPIDHLTELLSFLKPGGELVLETLVIEGDEATVLVPEDRYAKMANVWFIPSPAALSRMVTRAGFRDSSIVDITLTTTEEQRATRWMDFESLADFLDPADDSRTIEGYPAPCRATLIAKKPA